MSTTSFLGVKRRRNGSKPRYMEGKDAWRSLRLLRAVAEKKMRGEIMRFSCDQWGLKQEHNKCLIAGLPVETAGVMRDVLILHTLRVFRLTSVSVSLRFEKQWNGRASHDHFCVALLLEMMWSIVLSLHALCAFRLTSVSVSLRFGKQWNGRASHDHFCVALLLEMMWSVESQKNYWQR